MANLREERKIEINEWIIAARWFYMAGLFLAGLFNFWLVKTSQPFLLYILAALMAGIFLNVCLFARIKKIKQKISAGKINFLSILQIGLELISFSTILYFSGGYHSPVVLLYVIPIISSSLIFGGRGSSFTALAAVILLNVQFFLAAVGQSSTAAVEFDFLGIFNSIELSYYVSVSIFYMLIGIFAGYGSKLLLAREQILEKHAEKLDHESKQKAKQMDQLDHTAHLLVKRDLELTKMNNELDKKILEIEESQNNLMKALREVENERNKTLAIISNLTDPVIVIDSENRINLFNHAAMETLGMANSDIGQAVSSKNHFSIENFSEFIKHEFTFKKIEEDEEARTLIEEVTLKFAEGEGDVIYKVITANVVDDENHFIGVMKVFFDLTREKMIDQMKSDFISIAAHQLRTPLAAIKWIMKMLLDGDMGELNPEQKDLLGKGFVSTERVIELVNDLLNVSRIEEGRFGYNFAMVKFDEILNIVLENTEKIAQERNIKLVVAEKPEIMPEIYMDKSRINMVVQNMVENSIKYTPELGKIEIRIIKTKNNLLEFSVKDNGVGIPEADKRKLFSKFFRASNVIRMETEGTGLGLFIARNIIEKHGGQIKVESEEGVGTTVSFTLPLPAGAK